MADKEHTLRTGNIHSWRCDGLDFVCFEAKSTGESLNPRFKKIYVAKCFKRLESWFWYRHQQMLSHTASNTEHWLVKFAQIE